MLQLKPGTHRVRKELQQTHYTFSIANYQWQVLPNMMMALAPAKSDINRKTMALKHIIKILVTWSGAYFFLSMLVISLHLRSRKRISMEATDWIPLGYQCQWN